MEERKQTAVTELSAKHQKVVSISVIVLLLICYEPPLSFWLSPDDIQGFLFSPPSWQNLESLEAQVIDALSERDKAAETISSLQVSPVTKFLSSIIWCYALVWN